MVLGWNDKGMQYVMQIYKYLQKGKALKEAIAI